MVTKVRKIFVNQPFDGETQIKARALIESGRYFEKGIWTNRDATAQRCEYENWKHVPEAVRKCVDQIGRAASIRAKALKKEIKERELMAREPSLFQDNSHQESKQLEIAYLPSEEDWYEEVAGSKTLRHALHPEDESALIAFFQNN
jgi:hypothetical protein